jgi:TonB family protein
MFHKVFLFLVLACLFGVSTDTSAGYPASASQTTDEVTRAVSYYQEGANAEAIKLLRAIVDREKRNVRAWHYLGLALEKTGDRDEARKAHERAAKLGDELLDYTLDRVQGTADFRVAFADIANDLLAAGQSAQQYLQLEEKPSRSKRLDWGERAESLLTFAEIANGEDDPEPLFKPSQVDVKAQILSRPLPSYTEEARQSQIRGRIVIKVVLGADGKVTGIRPITTLPGGLTAKAMRCAQQIKFIPAMKDGKPVSTWVQVEYGFNIY